jgi:hypothetical protein
VAGCRPSSTSPISSWNADAAGQLHADFTNQLTGWSVSGNAAIAHVDQSSLHIQVTPRDTMRLDSGSLPFAAAGSAHTFTVNAMVRVGSRGEGCAIAVFQDGSLNELGRAVMQIVPLPISLGAP